MEWAVLLLFALAAAAWIGRGLLPARSGAEPVEALLASRAALLLELRELDEDEAASRISAADRLAGRRALAPDLRSVTEALRESAESDDARPSSGPPSGSPSAEGR